MNHNTMLQGFQDDQFQSCHVDAAFLLSGAFFLFENHLHFLKGVFHTRVLKGQLIEI